MVTESSKLQGEQSSNNKRTLQMFATKPGTEGERARARERERRRGGKERKKKNTPKKGQGDGMGKGMMEVASSAWFVREDPGTRISG